MTELGLPSGMTTCLFDLDGVLTQTAKIHARAWKEMFDDFLRNWAERTGGPFQEFDRPTDYDEYVDGKPRLEGVHWFLLSRDNIQCVQAVQLASGVEAPTASHDFSYLGRCPPNWGPGAA